MLEPALAWLKEQRSGDPFFAWVHFYDAHAPYRPPPPFDARFRRHPYDGEIAYVDSALGRLVALLEQKGVLDRTLVVAVGDHGESLGEHGEEDHGLFLYDAVLSVPMIVRLPGRARAGTVVREQVRSVDLLPTMLEALGVRPTGAIDGESLLAVAQGRPRKAVPLSYAETFYPRLHFGWSELKSARVGEWKLVDAPTPELYDLRVDRREAVNLAGRNPTVADRLSADLRVVGGSFSAAPAAQPPPSAETLERLRSLGYVGLAGGPGPASGRGADPKDMVPRLREFRRLMTDATGLLRRGQAGAAVPLLKRALAVNERAYDVHLALGDAYLQQGLAPSASTRPRRCCTRRPPIRCSPPRAS
ncbi:MAG: Sulfatase [Acidobacteria bacterium]|nr:Sulfatase [Acidobacteriota bacterium]